MDSTSQSAPRQPVISDELLRLFPPDDDGYNWIIDAPAGADPLFVKFLAAGVPGTPDVILPKHHDAFLFVAEGSYDPESELKTWDQIVGHLAQAEQEKLDRSNSCITRWKGRAEDRPTVARSDYGLTLSREFRDKLDAMTRALSISDFLNHMPAPIHAMGVILDVIARLSGLLFPPIGRYAAVKEEDEDWRWSRPVALLAGFGVEVFRVFAEAVAKLTGNPIWHHYASLSNESLLALFRGAWEKSGYSCSTILIDFPAFDRLLRQEDARNPLGRVPFIYKALLIIHIVKHVRLRRDASGDIYLHAAYRGREQRIPVSKAGANLSLAEQANQNVAKAIDTVLLIDRGLGMKNRTKLHDAARSAFKELTPSMLAEPTDLAWRPEILVPSAIVSSRAHEDEETRFINPGIVYSRFAVVNVRTGAVDTEATASGPDVLTFAWPHGVMDETATESWFATLPQCVKAERPSAIVRRLIRNINSLGYDRELDAVIDALIFGFLLYKELVGSPIGLALEKERPPVFFLPTNADDPLKTTNTGKTNLARLLTWVNSPTAKVVGGNCITGAPAQREYLKPIREDGTAIYDDWKMPPANKGYVLDQAGIQTLTCGEMLAVGEAGVDGRGVRLTNIISFTGKYLRAPADVLNRSVPIHQDPLTEETRNTDDLLTMITSSQASKLIRISALLLAHQTGLVEKLRSMKPISSDVWRFYGLATIASHFLGGETAGLKAFFQHSIEHCKAQVKAAHDVGLDEEIGDTDSGFDPIWFFENSGESVMFTLAVLSLRPEPLSPRDALDAIVRNPTPGVFREKDPDRVMRNEASCVKRFTNALKESNNRLVHPSGFVLEYVPKKLSTKKINGKGVAYILVTHPTRQIPDPIDLNARSTNVIPLKSSDKEADVRPTADGENRRP